MSDLTAESIAHTEQSSLFKLKGSRISVSVLELYDYDYERFNQELEGAVAAAPQLFKQMPVVIDLEQMVHDSFIDFIEMCQLLNEFGLSPVAVSGGSEEQQLGASVAGLAKIERSGSKTSHTAHDADDMLPSTTKATQKSQQQKTTQRDAHTDTPNTSSKQAHRSEWVADFEPLETTSDQPIIAKIIRQPIRSGQQIYAKNADLIIVGPVSQGAEILADGNIHVYGPLRGRALAGVRGNTEAMIFCSNLEAELISIAGTYKVIDDIKQTHWQQAVHIRLLNNQLIIQNQ